MFICTFQCSQEKMSSNGKNLWKRYSSTGDKERKKEKNNPFMTNWILKDVNFKTLTEKNFPSSKCNQNISKRRLQSTSSCTLAIPQNSFCGSNNEDDNNCSTLDSIATDEVNADDIFPWLLSLEESETYASENSDQLLEAFIARQNKYKEMPPRNKSERNRRLSLELFRYEPRDADAKMQKSNRRNSYSIGQKESSAGMPYKSVEKCQKFSTDQKCHVPDIIPKLCISEDNKIKILTMSFDQTLHSSVLHNSKHDTDSNSTKWHSETESSRTSAGISSTSNYSSDSSSAYCDSSEVENSSCIPSLSNKGNQIEDSERREDMPSLELNLSINSNRRVQITQQVSERSSCSEGQWYEVTNDTELLDLCSKFENINAGENETTSSRSNSRKSKADEYEHSNQCQFHKTKELDSHALKRKQYQSIQKLRQQYKLQSSERKSLIDKKSLAPIISIIQSPSKNVHIKQESSEKGWSFENKHCFENQELKFETNDELSEKALLDSQENNPKDISTLNENSENVSNETLEGDFLTITPLLTEKEETSNKAVNDTVGLHDQEDYHTLDSSRLLPTSTETTIINCEFPQSVPEGPRSSSPEPDTDLQKTIDLQIEKANKSLHLDFSGLQLPFYPTAVLCSSFKNLKVCYSVLELKIIIYPKEKPITYHLQSFITPKQNKCVTFHKICTKKVDLRISHSLSRSKTPGKEQSFNFSTSYETTVTEHNFPLC